MVPGGGRAESAGRPSRGWLTPSTSVGAWGPGDLAAELRPPCRPGDTALHAGPKVSHAGGGGPSGVGVLVPVSPEAPLPLPSRPGDTGPVFHWSYITRETP